MPGVDISARRYVWYRGNGHGEWNGLDDTEDLRRYALARTADT